MEPWGRGTATFGVSFILYSFYRRLGDDLATIPHRGIDDGSVLGGRFRCASRAVHKSDRRD
jgi:hypothetical protein